MNEMMERIAKVLDPPAWKNVSVRVTYDAYLYYDHSQVRRKESLKMARMLIETMREPTQAMINAKIEEGESLDTGLYDYSATKIWQTMIDEALK